MGCHADIPYPAWKWSSFEPVKGDSIKIIGWKSAFGRVIIYRMAQTNFGEETYERQVSEYEAELAVYRDAAERNLAMRHGISVEEYRRRAKVWMQRFVEVSERIQNDKELLENMRNIRPLDVGCLQHREMDFWQYAETGTFPDQAALEHLRACKRCADALNQGRERYLGILPTAVCLSDEECALVEQTGKLPPSRFRHVKRCYRCLARFEHRRQRHFENPAGPDCLTEDDRHVIHSSGEVPEHRRAHLASCERCKKEAKRQRNVYIDNLIPVPPHPRRRLKSLRKREEVS